MQHSFDVEDAKKYGVNGAVLLQNLRFWIAKNIADGTNKHDGRTWTYGSISSFEKLFPYFSAKQLRNTLNNLVKESVLIRGNYNSSAYDRTYWYAFFDECAICPKVQMDATEGANQKAQEGAPIQDINTDITEITTTTYSAFVQKNAQCTRFDEFWSAYPRKQNKKRSRDIWTRKKLDKLADMIIADVTRRRIDDAQWSDGFIPHATTYLNGHRWEDEIITKRVSNHEINRTNSSQPIPGARQETRGEMHARVNRELYEAAVEREMDGSAHREVEDTLQRAFYSSDREDGNGCQGDASRVVTGPVRLHR